MPNRVLSVRLSPSDWLLLGELWTGLSRVEKARVLSESIRLYHSVKIGSLQKREMYTREKV